MFLTRIFHSNPYPLYSQYFFREKKGKIRRLWRRISSRPAGPLAVLDEQWDSFGLAGVTAQGLRARGSHLQMSAHGASQAKLPRNPPHPHSFYYSFLCKLNSGFIIIYLYILPNAPVKRSVLFTREYAMRMRNREDQS